MRKLLRSHEQVIADPVVRQLGTHTTANPLPLLQTRHPHTAQPQAPSEYRLTSWLLT